MRAPQDRAQSGGIAPALRGGAMAVGIALLIAVAPARATYSIAAVDLDSGQAGGAGTSCVGSDLSVYEIFGAAPGSGVVMAQAALNRDARDRAVELLLQGTGAEAVLAEITGADFDFAASVRQYAVVDARGVAVGFTGDDTMAYADDVQGREGDVVYSVQGNILTGAAVLEQAAGVFVVPGCDLADTLMRALAAGADDEQGDSRCTPDGIPSDGAFIRVDLADGSADAPYLELQVDDTAPEDPIAALRALYDDWRGEHPCPAPEPDAPDAGSGGQNGGSGAPDAGTAGAAGIAEPPRAGSAGVQAGSAGNPPTGGAGGAAPAMSGAGTGGAGAAAAGAGLGGASGSTTSAADGDANGGCAVAAQPAATRDGAAVSVGFAALALALLRPRARRRASSG